MRRLIATAGAAALLTALIMGPLSTSAAAPYVYGCTPVSRNISGTQSSTVTLYNGSATTANITMRLLAFDGTNLSALMAPVPQTFTIGATTTKWVTWSTNTSVDPAVSNTLPSSVRVVSDQPLAVGINAAIAGNVLNTFECMYFHP